MTHERGRAILILGLAREGVSLARYFASCGCQVTVTDSAPAERLEDRLRDLYGLPIAFFLGGDYPDLVADADEFFVSPGVPAENAVYAAALDSGLEIQSMTTLFFDLCPGRIIGITGSSGKTTTTGLLGHILQSAEFDAVVGGNIGDPMLDLLPQIGPQTLAVLELSSFQLELLRRSPSIAVVTNISPNHLDRHGTMERYIRAKRHIVEHQGEQDYAVLNADDPGMPTFRNATAATIRLFSRCSDVPDGAALRGDAVGIVRGGVFTPVLGRSEIPLRGEHNVENVLAAIAAADLAGVAPRSMATAIRTFQPAPHRLQTVAEIDDVVFVDDSIATSPARAAVALRAIETPIILIAGGRDKNLPWDEFAQLAIERVRALILIGEAAPLIERAVREALESDATPAGNRQTASLQEILRRSSLHEAVDAARSLAGPGDTVLLSPGCTSFDMFASFEERGAVFAQSVEVVGAA